MSAHSSVPHLSDELLSLRNELEYELSQLEGIHFVGVALLEAEGQVAAKITLGTTRLRMAKAQLARVVPMIEKKGLENVELQLVRGVLG